MARLFSWNDQSAIAICPVNVYTIHESRNQKEDT